MALLDAAYILGAVRNLLNEKSSIKWPDDQINKWVQEAAMDISIKTLGYEGIDVIGTVANTLESDEPSGCIKVHSCVKGGALRSWEAHLDDDDWQQVYWHFTWNGSAWVKQVAGGASADIRVKSSATWEENYVPTKMRITYSGQTDCQFTLSGVGGYHLAADTTLASEEEVDLEIDKGDIRDLGIKVNPAGSDVSITNIEFYATGTLDANYKGLGRIHPRLVQHVAHNEAGEPIHYYHHHNKVGIWPLPDDAYALTVYISKVTDDITDLPTELRLPAILYCLAMARLSEGWEDDFEMFITMYLNSLMAYRQGRGQYKLEEIDSKDMFEIPNRAVSGGQ